MTYADLKLNNTPTIILNAYLGILPTLSGSAKDKLSETILNEFLYNTEFLVTLEEEIKMQHQHRSQPVNSYEPLSIVQ
jgi:hypothetical protein